MIDCPETKQHSRKKRRPSVDP